MNKLNLLLLFFLLITFYFCEEEKEKEKEEEDNKLKVDFIFNITINVLKGFSKDNERKCIQVLYEQEQLFKEIIGTIMEDINNKKGLEDIFKEVGLKLITIHGFAKQCNILLFIPILKTKILDNLEDLKSITSERLLDIYFNNSNLIYSYMKNGNGTFEAFGKMFSDLWNFQVK